LLAVPFSSDDIEVLTARLADYMLAADICRVLSDEDEA